MSIYISGALKGSKDIDRARAKYESIASVLRHRGMVPYVPHKTTDPEFNRDATPETVFALDLAAIHRSKAAVLILDEPSLGVGLEIGLFASRDIPLLILCEQNCDLSRFAAGFLAANNHEVIRYTDDLEDVIDSWATRMLQGLRLSA